MSGSEPPSVIGLATMPFLTRVFPQPSWEIFPAPAAVPRGPCRNTGCFRATIAGTAVALPICMTRFEERATWQAEETMQLDLCHALDQIVVRTRHSVYEVIVLNGDAGEVFVRGGRFFPDFQRARIEGSTAGGSAVKLRSICVGLHMELNVGGKLCTTSTIQAVLSGGLSATGFPVLDSESENMRAGSGEPGAGSGQPHGAIPHPNLAG